MYIGLIDYRGLYYLVWEIVDNVMDEVLVGFGSEIIVIIKFDNVIEVLDDGCGMLYKKYIFGVLII